MNSSRRSWPHGTEAGGRGVVFFAAGNRRHWKVGILTIRIKTSPTVSAFTPTGKVREMGVRT